MGLIAWASIRMGSAFARWPVTVERNATGEAIDSIALILAVIFLFHFQPKNRMSSPRTT
jgi:hypothetical protein